MSNDKPWQRPWEIQEIVDNASNWSLAGDAGLLKHLEKFSENMLARAEETNNNLTQLLRNLDNTSLSLDITKNEFLSLQNTQFIESRVYEDDETIGNIEAVAEKEIEKDEITKADLVEAALIGIEVVNKYYDKIEVTASDSEDDSDLPNFLLRPKDPYLARPLPFVIGSEEWHKKWHVGLEESSSDSDAESISDKYSDTDSETDLPISNRAQVKGFSAHGSEEFSEKIRGPVANSTFNDSAKQDMLESSDSEENHSYPAQAPISNSNFADQLAAKLGNVVQQNVPEPEINRRLIQPSTGNNKYVGNLFDDEPPPLDEPDDGLFAPNNNQGLFSGGGGLFDDENDNDAFWGNSSKKQISAREDNPKKDPANLIFDVTSRNDQKVKAPTTSGGLFDDSESDDDLFSTNRTKTETHKPYLQPIKTTLPFPSDEPPELDEADKKTNKKKPIGGISPFGNVDLFGQQKIGEVLKSRRKPSTSSEEELQPSIKVEENATPKMQEPKREATPEEQKSVKKISLFDDDDDLFKEDFLSSGPTKKFTSHLFDSDSEPDFLTSKLADDSKSHLAVKSIDNTENLEATGEIKSPEIEAIFKDKGKAKISSLFDDFEDDVEDDLFSIKPKMSETRKAVDFTSEDFSSDLQNHSETTPKDDVNSDEKSAEVVLKSDAAQDLGDLDMGRSSEESPPPVIEAVAEAKPDFHVDLFSSSPPPLDDEWDTKSENNLDENLLESYEPSTIGRSSLFDNEPPSLFANESSGIVRDQSQRLEQDDSSFFPYASSTRRFSVDIYNEQQSADSFFVTKNQISSSTHPILDKIPEVTTKIDSESNINITPSGISGDLYSESTVNTSSVQLPESVSSKTTEEENEQKEDLDWSKEDVFASNDLTKIEAGTSSNLLVSKSGLPGKLSHNLKINVSALLPAAAGSRRKDLPKSRSLDNPSPEEEHSRDSTKSNESALKTAISEKSMSLDKPTDGVETLHSITKDRARVIKRRPSTRKGRQEQLRKSGADFKISSPPEDVTNIEQNTEAVTKENIKSKIHPVKDSSPKLLAEDDVVTQNKQPTQLIFEDLFGNDGEDIFAKTTTTRKYSEDFDELFSSKDQPKKETKPHKALFDSPDSESDLFAVKNGGVKPQSKGLEKSASNDLFDDTDDDSLFGTSNVKKKTKKKHSLFDEEPTSFNKPKSKSKINKKSLFDDDADDDDDIFSSSATKKVVAKNTAPARKEEKKPQKSAKLKKVETDVVDDPLDVFKN